MGRYFTPRNASGINTTIISALKITAASTALLAAVQPHDVESPSPGRCP